MQGQKVFEILVLPAIIPPMQAFLSIKYHPDNSNRPLIEQLSALLERHGLRSVCVIRDVERWGEVHLSPAELMHATFALIDASDLLVVEFSEKGVGLGIEAGYAYARGIPILTLARQGCEVSTTLAGISTRVIVYASWEALDAALLAEENSHNP